MKKMTMLLIMLLVAFSGFAFAQEENCIPWILKTQEVCVATPEITEVRLSPQDMLLVFFTAPVEGYYKVNYIIKNKAGTVVRQDTSGWFYVWEGWNGPIEFPIGRKLKTGRCFTATAKVFLRHKGSGYLFDKDSNYACF